MQPVLISVAEREYTTGNNAWCGFVCSFDPDQIFGDERINYHSAGFIGQQRAFSERVSQACLMER